MDQQTYDRVQQYVRQNDVSMGAACRALGINPQQFYNWKSTHITQAKRKRSLTTKPRKRKPRYQAITVAASPTEILAAQQAVTVIMGSPDDVLRVLGGLKK